MFSAHWQVDRQPRYANRVMRIVLLIAGLIVSLSAPAEVYRWVDADGSVNYSDRPQEGAERVTLPSAQTFKAPIVNRRPPAAAPADTQPAAQYQFVEIVRPIQEEVLWNTGGQIDVAVRVEPQLQTGHSLMLFLDGEPVEGLASGQTRFTLTEIFRGQHELRAEVRGTGGIKLIESGSVKFTVQQTSVLNPNNPNAGAF